MKFLLRRLALIPFFFFFSLVAPAQDASGNPPIRIACVGDSITQGRYIRVHGKTRVSNYGFSLWEIEVFEQ